ncbi:MAG: efflux RND transporter periplasmic adaptor subunit [Verrucomicrobia bacterium]|nr:efflux RND transporter periplasmic adaptor subunit [Verrucomicrobiota bacterium]
MTPTTSSMAPVKSSLPKSSPPAKKRPPYIRAVLIAILLLIAIIGVLGYFKVTQIMGFMALAKAGAFNPPPTAVTTTVAATSEWQPTMDTIGTVAAINGVTVSTDLAGIVDKIAFTSGTKVKKGDLLVHLNTDQEQAQLGQAQAQLDLALLTLNRDRDLLAKRAIAQQDYDTAEASYRQFQATVNQYKALIARKTLCAPFDGVVGIRQVNLGQYLNTGDPVVTLQSFDPIYVNFTLPQQDLSKLAVGQEVNVQLDAYGQLVFSGNINAINSLVDQATRNVQVQATLPNSNLKLRPGMFGKVSVVLPEHESVIALPVSSVHYAPYGDSVFIVTEAKGDDGKPYKTVKEQFVKLGAARGDLISITSGVKPGDEVVTSGVFRLKSGAPITINNKIKPDAEASPTPANS